MSDSWIIVIILIVVALCALALLVLLALYVREYWKFMELPHEEPKPLIHVFHSCTGSAEFVDEQEQYRQIYERFKGTGPFCGFYKLLEPRVLVLERELVKQILINDFSNFNDHGVYNNAKDDPLSADLYNRHGSGWREMRIKLDPIFRAEQIRLLHASVYEDSHQLLQACDAMVLGTKGGVAVEMHLLMRRFVLRCIAKCVFGLDATLQQKYPLNEFDQMTKLLLGTHRHGEMLTTTIRNHSKLGRHLRIADTNKRAANYFIGLIEDVVSQREASTAGELHTDFLQLLIDIKTQELSTHESDEKDSEPKILKQHLISELASHAISFLKSGLEPTASTLSYVLYELADNQEEQQRVREEIQAAMARHDNELSHECVQGLSYLWQVILETVRLHPHKPYLVRRTLQDYRVPCHPKYLIRKDMYVIIPTDAMHHDTANFAEPHLFKPERFALETNRMRDQCVWLGFGEGPRNCIGMHFAQLQMRIALARLLLNYKFSLDMRKVVIKCEDGVSLLMESVKKTQDKRHTLGGTEGEIMI